MKLRYSLLIAFGCCTIHFIAQCLSIFLLNGEEYMTIFECDRVRGMSFNNINVWFGIFGVLTMVFFAISLLKMQRNVRPKGLNTTVVILECLSAFYSLLILIPKLHIIILYGGQHLIGDWDYWEVTGREIAPMLYKILFNDHLYISLWDSQINIVHNLIVVPLVNLLLLVVFCRMKNLIPLTRIIGILACLIPIIYHMATLFGINVYTPMLGQTFIITNGLLWCTMLLLLYMNTKTQN